MTRTEIVDAAVAGSWITRGSDVFECVQDRLHLQGAKGSHCYWYLVMRYPEHFSIYVPPSPPKPTPEEVLVALGQGRWVATDENQYSHKDGVLVWKRPPKNNILTSSENITWVIRNATKILDQEEGE